MAPIDTLKPSQTGGSESPDPEQGLRERIFALVYPETPLTLEVISSLLEEALATGEPDVCAELITTVHGRGAVRDARELAARCAAHFPESERMARLVRLMAPPRVVPSPPIERIDRRPDYAWLKEHAREYPGEWLVLCDGKLWGHAVSLREAEEQAREAGLTRRPYLYQVSQA